MKIELEVIKNFLEAFRNHKQPNLNIRDLAVTLDLDFSSGDDLRTIYHYLQILNDQGLIAGVALKPEQQSTLGFSFAGAGTIIIPNLSILLRLTHEGHKVAESLSQSKIYEISKKQIATVGIETLKMLPALGLEYIKSQLNL